MLAKLIFFLSYVAKIRRSRSVIYIVVCKMRILIKYYYLYGKEWHISCFFSYLTKLWDKADKVLNSKCKHLCEEKASETISIFYSILVGQTLNIRGMSSDSYVLLCTLFTLFLFFLPSHYSMVPPIAPVSFLVPLFHSLVLSVFFVLQFCLPHFLFLTFCNSIVLAFPSFLQRPCIFPSSTSGSSNHYSSNPSFLGPLHHVLRSCLLDFFLLGSSNPVYCFLVPPSGKSFLGSPVLSPWYSFMVPPHPRTSFWSRFLQPYLL